MFENLTNEIFYLISTTIAFFLKKKKLFEEITPENFSVCKVSKYRVSSGLYFPVFGPEKTPYLDTFHAMFHNNITFLELKSFLKCLNYIFLVQSYQTVSGRTSKT